jgi:hypothetical protein
MRKTDPSEVNVDQLRRLGYERTDVSLPTLVRWIIFLFGFVAFCSVAAWIIYKVFVPEIAEENHTSPQAYAKIAPGNPPLQSLPKRDIREFREREDRVADSYGWADKNAGTVHIPLEKAMEDVAEHGLPPREAGPIPSMTPTPTPPVSGGLNTPSGEPGSQLTPVQPAGPGRGAESTGRETPATGSTSTEGAIPTPSTGAQAPH